PLITQQAASGAASAALRSGQLPAALARLENDSAGPPDGSERHRVLGVAYWADGQFDKSIQQFTVAIQLEPRDERSRIALADELVVAGRTTAAQQALRL